MVGKLNKIELITYFITISVCIDVLFVQWPGIFKVNQTFPSIGLFGFTLTINELIVSVYVAFAFLYLVAQIAKDKTFRVGPYNLKKYILPLYLLIIYGVFVGILNSNGGFLRELRAFIVPSSLYFIFINLPLKENAFLKIHNVIYKSFLLIGILNVVNLVIPNLYTDIIPLVGNNLSYYNISMTSFVLFHSFFSIIYKVRIKQNSLIALVIFTSSMLYLIKASIFGLLVTFGIIILWFLEQKSIKMFKIISILALLCIFTFTLFAMQPIEKKLEMISWVEYKFFNLDRNVIDISTGRFDIWRFYLNESLKGYGISPNGFGYISYYVDPMGHEYLDKGTHNIFIYYAYNFGLVAMMLLLIIVGKFFSSLSRLIKKISHKDTKICYLACFFWMISIVVINLGNLSIIDYRLAWVFWLIAADFTRFISQSRNNSLIGVVDGNSIP